jgi:hypothetical protein
MSELFQVSFQRFVLRTVSFCQELLYIDQAGLPARCAVGLVTHAQSLGIGIVPDEKPTIAVGTSVNENLIRHLACSPTRVVGAVVALLSKETSSQICGSYSPALAPRPG